MTALRAPLTIAGRPLHPGRREPTFSPTIRLVSAVQAAAVRQYSEDPVLGEPMVMNDRAATLEPRQRARLDFTVKLTQQMHRVTEADRQGLRDNGFSDADIWDISEVAGFFNMTNRVASATGMMPNPAYHAQAR